MWRCRRGKSREGVTEEMGAIGGDELLEWDRMGGPEAVNGGGGGVGRLDRIQVLVRLRPLNEKEIARGEPAEWECINDTTVMFRSTFPDRPTAPTAYTFGSSSICPPFDATFLPTVLCLCMLS